MNLRTVYPMRIRIRKKLSQMFRKSSQLSHAVTTNQSLVARTF